MGGLAVVKRGRGRIAFSFLMVDAQTRTRGRCSDFRIPTPDSATSRTASRNENDPIVVGIVRRPLDIYPASPPALSPRLHAKIIRTPESTA